MLILNALANVPRSFLLRQLFFAIDRRLGDDSLLDETVKYLRENNADYIAIAASLLENLAELAAESEDFDIVKQENAEKYMHYINSEFPEAYDLYITGLEDFMEVITGSG